MIRQVLLGFSLTLSLGLSAIAQDPKPATPATGTPPASSLPQDPALAVSVPTFHNATCPIMGKKVSMKLFTDTELGRLYICCKGCDKKILKDVPTAYKTAYPTTKQIGNKTCPVSGEPIGDSAHAVTLQGYEFKVCCKDCIAEAQKNAQVVLAKVTSPEVVDVGNATCPVTGEPVANNAFAKVGAEIVRLSSPQCVEAIQKDPQKMLAKAKEIAKAKKSEKHEHGTDHGNDGGKKDGGPEHGDKKTEDR